jgi:hypothetical protein
MEEHERMVQQWEQERKDREKEHRAKHREIVRILMRRDGNLCAACSRQVLQPSKGTFHYIDLESYRADDMAGARLLCKRSSCVRVFLQAHRQEH